MSNFKLHDASNVGQFGGEAEQFGGGGVEPSEEEAPAHPPLDETLFFHTYEKDKVTCIA